MVEKESESRPFLYFLMPGVIKRVSRKNVIFDVHFEKSVLGTKESSLGGYLRNKVLLLMKPISNAI